MNNAVFGKTTENLRNHRDIKLVTTKARRNLLGSQPNYHTTIFFIKLISDITEKQTQILMNKPVYLSLLVLELSEIVMFEFWYDYVKPKYGEQAKSCYMDTDSFVVCIKTEDIYTDIAKDIETRFDTSSIT